MSLIKANAIQVGQSPTVTQNFTLEVPSSPDGTIKLARGNAGATTQDVMNVSNAGVVSFPQGFSGNASSATVLATGSLTTRSLANRFADVVNVKDFGAVGDGITDDTAAIQAAVNAVSANPIGGTLYFSDGIYITQEITVGSNIIIEGNGTTLKGKTGQNYIFRLTGLENITIQNFNFDCIGLSNVNTNPLDIGLKSSAIYVRLGSGLFNNVKILNNRFINIPTTSQEYHAIGFNSVNCIVSNNFSDQCGGDVFNFNGGINIVTNNQIRNGGDGGVAFNNGARGIISDNYIYKCNLGVGCGPEGFTTDTSYNNTLQIDSNTIDSCDWGVNLGWFGFVGREGPENF